MRIVSLQPSVTVTLAGLGALEKVVACTRHCKALVPEITDEKRLIVEDSWSASAEEILSARPDLVIASVPYRMESLAEILRAGVRVVALAPRSLTDVYDDIRTLSSLVDARFVGERLINELRDEVEMTRGLTAKLPAQRVFCEEWGKPLMASQPWVAELIAAAGGVFVGEPGEQIELDAVADEDPEVLLAAWCGTGDRVPLEKVVQRPGWRQTTAARNGRVFCIADELLNTPAHTLAAGLRAIRWALHPGVFWRPSHGIRTLEEEAAVA